MDNRNWMALAVALGVLGLAGCNTVKGVGRDVQGAGEAVEDASEDVEEDIKEEKND